MTRRLQQDDSRDRFFAAFHRAGDEMKVNDDLALAIAQTVGIREGRF